MFQPIFMREDELVGFSKGFTAGGKDRNFKEKLAKFPIENRANGNWNAHIKDFS